MGYFNYDDKRGKKVYHLDREGLTFLDVFQGVDQSPSWL